MGSGILLAQYVSLEVNQGNKHMICWGCLAMQYCSIGFEYFGRLPISDSDRILSSVPSELGVLTSSSSVSFKVHSSYTFLF